MAARPGSEIDGLKPQKLQQQAAQARTYAQKESGGERRQDRNGSVAAHNGADSSSQQIA